MTLHDKNGASINKLNISPQSISEIDSPASRGAAATRGRGGTQIRRPTSEPWRRAAAVWRHSEEKAWSVPGAAINRPQGSEVGETDPPPRPRSVRSSRRRRSVASWLTTSGDGDRPRGMIEDTWHVCTRGEGTCVRVARVRGTWVRVARVVGTRHVVAVAQSLMAAAWGDLMPDLYLLLFLLLWVDLYLDDHEGLSKSPARLRGRLAGARGKTRTQGLRTNLIPHFQENSGPNPLSFRFLV